MTYGIQAWAGEDDWKSIEIVVLIPKSSISKYHQGLRLTREECNRWVLARIQTESEADSSYHFTVLGIQASHGSPYTVSLLRANSEPPRAAGRSHARRTLARGVREVLGGPGADGGQLGWPSTSRAALRSPRSLVTSSARNGTCVPRDQAGCLPRPLPRPGPRCPRAQPAARFQSPALLDPALDARATPCTCALSSSVASRTTGSAAATCGPSRARPSASPGACAALAAAQPTGSMSVITQPAASSTCAKNTHRCSRTFSVDPFSPTGKRCSVANPPLPRPVRTVISILPQLHH